MAPLLVVDNDRATRRSLRDLFTVEGFDVEEAGNGLEALDRLDAGCRPALIVVDLMMPVMDGREFLRRMRERPERDTPVVVLTGMADAADACHLRERYGVEVLDKATGLVSLLEIARGHRAAAAAPRPAA